MEGNSSGVERRSELLAFEDKMLSAESRMAIDARQSKPTLC